jgi:putative CocE/NonD family hydrolase
MTPYQTKVLYNVRIKMRDGIELSANLFMPVPKTDGEKFPVILEMIPYRKDDWRYVTDHQRMLYFAERGFVCCRLDIRGTGSSQGIARDEYTAKETQDGYETVEWLAAQDWCNGNVGMWGMSYGGFTSIQVAKLQPPHLKAIVAVYATDDRYIEDSHYMGGCKTASEWAQYAVSQVGSNAMPPKAEYAGEGWAAQWKERLEKTPLWLEHWLRNQTDGAYWRVGSLNPEYEKITCALYSIGGWMDSYVNAAVRMHEKCINAPRKCLIGNWNHQMPDYATPGPNLDYLQEMTRFFEYWLKDIDNGIMNEPAFTFMRREYTVPEAFPALMNGEWFSTDVYPLTSTRLKAFYLGDKTLSAQLANASDSDHYLHRPTHGTASSYCWGAGAPPNGLFRDLRPDESVIPVYTSDVLTEPLDFMGMPESVLHLSSSAPVAYAVVRLTDVAPDGTSAQVTAGILNLTHRNSHEHPEALTPNEVYEVKIKMRATAYRFLPGHRIRLTISSTYWPLIFPSPYKADNYLHRGGKYFSRLILPVVNQESLPVPQFKTTPPEMIAMGESISDVPEWKIEEDVIAGSLTVKSYGGDRSTLPDGTVITTSERIDMTAYHQDPAHAQFYNDINYHLVEHGQDIHIQSTGSIRTTETDFHLDIQLVVKLNGNVFFQKSWLESIKRNLV